MLMTLVTYAQKRLAARRRYRQTLAQIASMSNSDLIELGAFESDLREAARKDYLSL